MDPIRHPTPRHPPLTVEYLGTDLDPHRCTPAAASNNALTTRPPKPSSTTRNPATFRRASASWYRSAPGTAPAQLRRYPSCPTDVAAIVHAHPQRHPLSRAVPSSHRERRPSVYMKGMVHAHHHPKEHRQAHCGPEEHREAGCEEGVGQDDTLNQ